MTLSEIGAKIHEVRKAKDITQEDLCRATGVSRSRLSLLERGTASEIGIRKVIHILEFLGLEFSIRPRGAPPTLDELQEELNRKQSS